MKSNQRTSSAKELEDMKDAKTENQKPDVSGGLGLEPSSVAPVQVPSCGRSVWFIPVSDHAMVQSNPVSCDKFPATVVEASDLSANMVVFNLGTEPAAARLSVPHESVVAKDENGVHLQSYWVWPEMK